MEIGSLGTGRAAVGITILRPDPRVVNAANLVLEEVRLVLLVDLVLKLVIGRALNARTTISHQGHHVENVVLKNGRSFWY